MRPKAENVAKGMYWDSTFSPYIGCTPCSPGCDNCWARRQEDGRLRHLNRMHITLPVFPKAETIKAEAFGGFCRQQVLRDANPYFHRGPVYQGDAVLEKAKRMKGVVFAGFRTDLFHEAVSFGKAWECIHAMRVNPFATFLIATKRASRLGLYFADRPRLSHINIRYGVSVCTQSEAAEKLPHLKALAERGLFTWASVEPMLGPIDLSSHLPYLKWVVCGGETGKGARPMDPDWARQVRDQCRAAGVPVWVKQMSKKAEIPADLLIRQWDETDL